MTGESANMGGRATDLKRPPRVSVGMPVYNGAAHLRETVDLILNQSFTDFELIISDNASTDATEEICREYASQDPRVLYLRHATNIGANGNYNNVFRRSSGTYFKWASSNDLCEKAFLARCVEVLDADPDTVLCYPRTRLFEEGGGSTIDYEDNLHIRDDRPSDRYPRVLQNLRLNNVMNGLIRSSALKQTSLIKNYFSSDCVLVAELALHGKFHEIPEFLFHRRMDEQTATKLMDEDRLTRHYRPEATGPMLMQSWKIIGGYWAAALRAPLDASERLRVLTYTAKQTAWMGPELARDLVQALASATKYIRRGRPGTS